jgi:hypothetical protein
VQREGRKKGRKEERKKGGGREVAEIRLYMSLSPQGQTAYVAKLNA